MLRSCRRTVETLLLSVALAASARAEEGLTPIEPETVSLGRPVEFAEDVAPILEANCVACHNVAIDEGGLSLEEVESILKGGDRGAAVVPGKPEESLLLTAASHRGEPAMPPPDNDVEARRLTARELGVLKQWIIEGAGRGRSNGATMVAWQSIPSHLKAIHAVAMSDEARFVAVGRSNQVELFDLALGVAAGRLVDPNLAGAIGSSGPLYEGGAADRDLIQSVAFAPDGRMLAAGGYRAVKLWRRTGPGETTPCPTGDGTVLTIAADGKRAAVASSNEVRVLAMPEGEVTLTWAAPSKAIGAGFALDGGSIAVGCEDGSLHLLRPAEGGTPAGTWKTPVATDLAIAGDRVVTAHSDGIVRQWAIGMDAPERELQGHSGPVRRVVAVPGEANTIATAGEDGTVRVWDLATGAQTRSVAHGAPIVDAAISADAVVLVTSGGDKLRFWKFADGSSLSEASGLASQQRAAKAAGIEFEWRKQLAGVAENRFKEAEAALKDREEMLRKSNEAREAAGKALEEAKRANDEAAAAAAKAAEEAAAKPDDEALRKQSSEAAAKSEEAKKKVASAEEAVRSAERSIELAEEAIKGTSERLESRKSEKLAAEEAAKSAEAASAAAAAPSGVVPQALAFTSDNRRFVATYSDGSLQTFTTGGEPLDAVAGAGAKKVFSFSDVEVLAIHADGTSHRVDVAGGWEFAGTLGPPIDTPLDLARSELADRVLALAFSPDGRLLATGGGEPSRGGELKVWDVESRRSVRTFDEAHSDTVQSVAFSRDGKSLATASADRFAKLFDAETGTLIRTFEGHTDHVLGVALKADGTSLATASADLGVKIWDAESGEQRRTVTGHGKPVTSVRFLGLSEEIVSTGGDASVRLHRSGDGAAVRSFSGPTDYVHASATSGDGMTIAAAGEDGVLFVWSAKDGKLLHRFEVQATGPATASR